MLALSWPLDAGRPQAKAPAARMTAPRGRLCERAPHGDPYESCPMETVRDGGTGPVRLVIGRKKHPPLSGSAGTTWLIGNQELRNGQPPIVKIQKKHYIRHPMRALFPECARHTR